MTDIDILLAGYNLEQDKKSGELWRRDGWSPHRLGADRLVVRRLADEGLVQLVRHQGAYQSYRLTEKGLGVVATPALQAEENKIPESRIMEAFEVIVGFPEIKKAMASTIANRRRVHYLLEGPPASAKSALMESIRQAVPEPRCYLAFGSRTTAAGLSDVLFETKPEILEMDELDKVRYDALSVLLGLMESGEVIETKSKRTRGIKLTTMVIAACNSSAKIPKEILSRFGFHGKLPPYTRQEFIDVCQGFLPRVGGCKPALAATIGRTVFDLGLGDVRRARSVWELMEVQTEEEMNRVISLMAKYSGDKRVAAAVAQGSFAGVLL